MTIDVRIFKTTWFTKAAHKARIVDAELCDAAIDVKKGQADNLGGGVLEKRLNQNMHRSIILARSNSYWTFAYLFAKKDRDNIDAAELAQFRLWPNYTRQRPMQIFCKI